MEEKDNMLTLYLLSFSTFSDIEFKTMILKTLQFVCTTEPDSNCEKSLHITCKIFFCLCKTLIRLHVDGEEENKEPRHHALSRNRDLNLLLAIGINELGNESSDVALKIFSSKMGLTGAEGLLADMECVLDILDRFSRNFYQITGASSIDTSMTDKQTMVEVVEAGGNSVLRVQKLLAMLKQGLKNQSVGSRCFPKKGRF